MNGDEREPYSWDAVEIGLQVGHITQLNSRQGRRRKHPVGFAPPSRKRKQAPSAGREAGTFPEVPHFDVQP